MDCDTPGPSSDIYTLSRQGLRRRTAVVAVLTVYVAWALYWGSSQITERVQSVNSARVITALMAGSAVAAEPPTYGTGSSILPFGGPPPRRAAAPDPKQLEALDRIKRQVATVEVLILVWKYLIWGLAAILAAVSLLSVATRWSRPLNLTAGGLILLSTVGTLVALRVAIDPDRGGMPPLPLRTYLAAAVVQSSYGFVLLALFWRRVAGRAQPLT